MSLKRLQKIQLNILDKIGQIEKLVGKEGDNLTRGLEIQLLHNSVVVDDISDIDCMLIAKQKGAGVEDTFVVPSIKVNNKFEIIYPSNLMKKGIVEAEIRFTQGESILTSFIFEIDMARTLVVEEITDSIYEQRLIDVIVDVVANEDARISNEKERKSNEDTRVSSEDTRITNEQNRISAENTREGNESSRIIAEDVRVSNESDRITGEDIRVINENLRVEAEIERDKKYTQIEQDYADRATTLEKTYAPRLTSAEQNIADNYQKLTTHLADYANHLSIYANKHIRESGGNSGGWYIRFDDGTQLCGTSIHAGPFDSGESKQITWTYPASFVEINCVVPTVGGGNVSQATEIRAGVNANQGLTSQVIYIKSFLNVNIQFAMRVIVFALGRWR